MFPDGTPFSIPDDDPAPPALDVPANARDRAVLLAVPLRRAGALEIDRAGSSREITRLERHELEVRDNGGLTAEPALLEIAALRTAAGAG